MSLSSSAARLLAAGGAFALSTAPADARFAADLLPGLVLLGLGAGLVFVAVSITAMGRHSGPARGDGVGVPDDRS